MIVLDASVLVGYLESADAHHQAAVKLLDELTGEPWAASQITLAEVLVGPARGGEGPLSIAERVLDELGVRELLLTDGSGAAALARLRASTGLKLPDCCVLLAAQDNDAALASFDRRLCRAARERSLTVHGGG